MQNKLHAKLFPFITILINRILFLDYFNKNSLNDLEVVKLNKLKLIEDETFSK